ncbi:hypothetical protein [Desulfocurvibacter africanus]|uniref:hypothetical protein n=1 Tax=Desulfocurvibacter africanus TaxID=873 RepID=UPI000486D0E2|nr:hypothetical protein [Desulfocurvibacter africanus]
MLQDVIAEKIYTHILNDVEFKYLRNVLTNIAVDEDAKNKTREYITRTFKKISLMAAEQAIRNIKGEK